MKTIQSFIVTVAMLFLLNSCSRKTNPGESTSRSVYGTDNNNAINSTTASTKPVAAKKNKTAVPKVIVVNDNVASKTFDGRYYYDLEGHRYWRNNKDGKYYLYNKSMANDPAFKKP